MEISDDALSYDHHIEMYSAYLTGDGSGDAYWHYNAQEMHALVVIDACGQLQKQIVSLGYKLSMGPAYHHLVFGAGRRSRMIWGAFRQLLGMVHPNRSNPLSLNDTFEVARSLNDIYIHMRGIVDNYAWTIRFLFGDPELCNFREGDISLFGRRFLANASVSGFQKIVAPFKDWHSEIKQRRDPVAHRIPLFVPNAFLNEEDLKRHEKIGADISSLWRIAGEVPPGDPSDDSLSIVLDGIGDMYDRQMKIGTFVPIIIHDPEMGGVRIYPTVSNDVGLLVKLVRALNQEIHARLSVA